MNSNENDSNAAYQTDPHRQLCENPAPVPTPSLRHARECPAAIARPPAGKGGRGQRETFGAAASTAPARNQQQTRTTEIGHALSSANPRDYVPDGGNHGAGADRPGRD